jgi:GNAT superfamily N-acetyltransferase
LQLVCLGVPGGAGHPSANCRGTEWSPRRLESRPRVAVFAGLFPLRPPSSPFGHRQWLVCLRAADQEDAGGHSTRDASPRGDPGGRRGIIASDGFLIRRRDQRTRRRGIATQLTHAAEEEARARGWNGISLSVSQKGNAAARLLYAKLGYHDAGSDPVRVTGHIILRGRPFDLDDTLLYLKKDLIGKSGVSVNAV